MSFDWGTYQVFDPEVDRPLHEVSRDAARRHFEKLMAEKEARKQALADLAARQGIALDGGPQCLDELEEWFRGNVEGSVDRHGTPKLSGRWYGVVNDLALYLGDLLIERHPHLGWELWTGGAKDLSYQRPVIMGFRVRNPKYHIDPDYALAVWGHRVMSGEKVDIGQLNSMLQSGGEFAEGDRRAKSE